MRLAAATCRVLDAKLPLPRNDQEVIELENIMTRLGMTFNSIVVLDMTDENAEGKVCF